MSMTDIVSAIERTGPTQLALVVFLVTFFVVVGRLLLPSRKLELARAAQLPLEDAPIATNARDGEKGGDHVKA